MAKRNLNHVTIPTQIAVLVGIVATLGTVACDLLFGHTSVSNVVLPVSVAILGISVISAIIEVFRQPGSLLTAEGREAALAANERGVRAAMDRASGRISLSRDAVEGDLDA